MPTYPDVFQMAAVATADAPEVEASHGHVADGASRERRLRAGVA